MRGYLALGLSLLLVMTGQGIAVARGMPGPAGQIVICTGSGPVMIAVDRDGQPTGHTQYCPEAAHTLLQALFSTLEPPQEVGCTTQSVTVAGVAHRAGLKLSMPQARGPPA